MTLIENALKIVDKKVVKRLRRTVAINDIQFGLMPDKCTTDAVFILRRKQEEYIAM